MLRKTAVFSLALILGMAFLFPVYWAVTTSVKSDADTLKTPLPPLVPAYTGQLP